MRGVVRAAALALALLAGCSGGGRRAAAPAPSAPSSTEACPAGPAPPVDPSDASVGSGDFDGDGRPDRLRTYRVVAAGPWRVRVELAAGGAAEVELVPAPDAVKALGGARLDAGAAEAALAVVGTNAGGVNVGIFVVRSCRLERVTVAGGAPAELPVRTGAGARSGLACQVPGLVAYSATTTDGRAYQASTVGYLLVGNLLDEAHRSTSTVAADDPALAPYGAFSCGSLRL
jgi:hypothetical protein